MDLQEKIYLKMNIEDATYYLDAAVKNLKVAKEHIKGARERLENDRSPIGWYVPCGCSHHGDHLGCDATCKEYDGECQHPLGVEITAATEQEADNHEHGPKCWSLF